MIVVTFNEDRCRQLYEALELDKPVRIRVYDRIRKTADGRSRYMGELLTTRSWTPDIHQVIVEAGNHAHLTGLKLKEEITVSFLHELRHAHQHEKWEPARWASELMLPYRAKPSEIDAESWAKTHWREWADVLTVRRKTPNSRFGKLSAAAERSRNE